MVYSSTTSDPQPHCLADTKCRELKPLSVSKSRLRELLELEDGKLYWKLKRKNVNAGDLAGGPTSDGYWRIKIDGRSYKRSRLVWLYINGVDSYPHFIDHVNRRRADDRIENLRLVSHAENQRNRAWGRSRFRYVYLEEGRWRARVSTPNGRVSLGRFDSETAAIEAVQQWEAQHGPSTRHR